MISELKGTLLRKGIDNIVVNVNGVGFKVFTPKNSTFLLNDLNDEIHIFTHLIVREQELSLYGFENETTISLFEKLISINGVGPKAGLAVLELSITEKIISAIANKDIAFINEANGIGKKTAERIVLELSDKFDASSDENYKQTAVSNLNDAKKDAIEALKTLGYKEFEVKKIISEMDDGLKPEEYIRLTLQQL